MRKKLVLGLIVSAICLYFVFRGVSVHDLAVSFRRAHLRWLAVGVSVYLLGYWLRAARWRELMVPIKPVSATRLFPVMIIGYFANNVLPLRMGELVRAYLTGQRFSVSRTASLATILIERICDTLSFLTTFLISALFFPFPPRIRQAALLLAAVCIGTVVGILVTVQFHEAAIGMLRRSPLPPRWHAPLGRVLANFTHGVSGLNRPSYIAVAMAYSLVIWGIEGFVLFLMSRAFSLQLTIPGAYFLLFFLGLSVTLPQAPGYVGTVELFGTAALSRLGIPKEQGLAFILAVHSIQFALIMAFGFWALAKEGLTLRSLLLVNRPADGAER